MNNVYIFLLVCGFFTGSIVSDNSGKVSKETSFSMENMLPFLLMGGNNPMMGLIVYLMMKKESPTTTGTSSTSSTLSSGKNV